MSATRRVKIKHYLSMGGGYEPHTGLFSSAVLSVFTGGLSRGYGGVFLSFWTALPRGQSV